MKKWPEECWDWCQKRHLKLGDLWYLIRKPFKVIRLAHFGLYAIAHCGGPAKTQDIIRLNHFRGIAEELDRGEPLGKSPFWRKK